MSEDTLSEEEYRLFTTLMARAERVVEAVLPEFLRETGNKEVDRNRHTLDHIEFKPLDRPGRDDRGTFDIELHYIDWERDPWSLYLPSSILWDKQGTIEKVLEWERLAREEMEREDARRTAAYREEADRAEAKRAKKWAETHGYKLVKD